MPFNVSDESLWSLLQDVGDIEYVRVVRDHKTNVGKGFGYVQFTDRASVSLALKCDGRLLDGRKVRITRAKEELAQVAKKPAPAVELGARAKRSGHSVQIRKRPVLSKGVSKKRALKKR